MRIIKFRAWNGEKIRYSFLVGRPQFADCLSIMTDEVFAKETYKVKEWKVMQFTGFKDKNGKEIYEGDVIKEQMQNELGSFSEETGEIHWCEAHCGFEVRTKNYTPETGANTIGIKCEILGNIYENPELLIKL